MNMKTNKEHAPVMMTANVVKMPTDDEIREQVAAYNMGYYTAGELGQVFAKF